MHPLRYSAKVSSNLHHKTVNVLSPRTSIWWGTPAGTCATSPALSSCREPPSIAEPRVSPGPTVRESTTSSACHQSGTAIQNQKQIRKSLVQFGFSIASAKRKHGGVLRILAQCFAGLAICEFGQSAQVRGALPKAQATPNDRNAPPLFFLHGGLTAGRFSSCSARSIRFHISLDRSFIALTVRSSLRFPTDLSR